MFRKTKPRVEITHDEHKALKALEENLKRQSKGNTEFAVTAKELIVDYLNLYPPSLFQKAFKVTSITVENLEALLISLSDKNLATNELRSYSDQALKVETRFFKINIEGKVRLHQKK